MKFLVSFTAGLLSVGLAHASPAAPLAKRAISSDGTCAGTKGYTCQGSSYGNCCSQYGWCGSTTGHCGTGCNSAFGSCTSSGTTSKPVSTSKPASASSSAPVSTTKASTVQSSSTTKSASASPSATPSGSVLQCLNGKNVPYKMTSDSAYAELVEPYNLRLPYKPAVVVLPNTNQHVQDAVVCAGQSKLKVQAKSGGHSYASFSSGGKDGSMMIDLQPMQTIQLDQGTRVATVGGGVRLGNLADGIFNQGNAALSHGTCPGVGIGGHFTHGGYSHTSRNWGLAMDQIIAADVVLANGTLVKATSSQNPDIFWAIRGAADSFGIVTTFYLQTRAAPASITYFQFNLNGVLNSKSVFTNTFLHLQDVAKNASVVDNKISFGVYLDNSGTYSLSGAYFGTVAEFTAKVKTELLRTLPSASVNVVQSMSWYDYLVKVSDKTAIKEPLTGYDEHDTFFAKSVTVPEPDGLVAKTVNALYDYLKTNGDVEYFVIINLYGGPGSAINSKDTTFAAYSERNSLWVLQNYGYGAESVDFINGINNAIITAQPQTTFGAYLNYVDPSYDAATAHRLYYGTAVYSRLAALKQQVDPQSVFWHPQAIGA
ncbi:carbohydrate-binding module family 18 [Cucurbitaria berberidis CBS 394.84]|uniref:Carbohydrate-binding module family 18 n=1 Tax=Cucurbitaria berberidis CBS 394.84 TaxID=1168544 RepID=A0A9P4L7B3_9PLEO|nr:carbohydrate-binding module family 18 [Cucurbitaria berberidis CBS 394.84]KAF1844760.1 carbohydrate-binding module family 18 [Cucurbitaria berberidis CBS 394.84]